ncbi:MAG TPA: FHA domain-containing protein [Mycobacteriales bacterium]|jgi:hypothetical protein|nr:FHA domain-containing protein [Mycobacteriales bacterium]
MDLAVFVVRFGVLALLWIFVIAAVVVVRSDVFGARSAARAAGGQTARRPAANTGGRPATATQARPRRRRDARVLAVTTGPLAGTTLTLGETPVTIGRNDDCTLVVSSDDYVSSRHARLTPTSDGWVLEDLQSTNGTYLDGQRVSGPVTVRVGTPIRVGQTAFELRR